MLKATEWFWIPHGWTLLSSYKQEIGSWNLLYEDLSIKKLNIETRYRNTHVWTILKPWGRKRVQHTQFQTIFFKLLEQKKRETTSIGVMDLRRRGTSRTRVAKQSSKFEDILGSQRSLERDDVRKNYHRCASGSVPLHSKRHGDFSRSTFSPRTIDCHQGGGSAFRTTNRNVKGPNINIPITCLDVSTAFVSFLLSSFVSPAEDEHPRDKKFHEDFPSTLLFLVALIGFAATAFTWLCNYYYRTWQVSRCTTYKVKQAAFRSVNRYRARPSWNSWFRKNRSFTDRLMKEGNSWKDI